MRRTDTLLYLCLLFVVGSGCTQSGSDVDIPNATGSPTTQENSRTNIETESVRDRRGEDVEQAALAEKREFLPYHRFSTEDLERWLPALKKRTRLDYYPSGGEVPDGLLRRMSEDLEGLERLIIAIGKADPPKISDKGMEYLSRIRSLRTLSLNAHFSDKGLAHLARLKNLERLGIVHADISAKGCFATVATLPKIRALALVHVDFSRPVDDQTYQAIASLNGRLQELSFGEWQESTIHVSMIPAIAEIESLTYLELGHCDATAEQLEPLRKNLHYLTTFGGPARARVKTISAYLDRDTHPVQFKEITSPTEMFVLFRHLLGLGEAKAISQEVVRRRAGIGEDSEDFTQSGKSIPQVLEESFGVTVPSDAGSRFYFIWRQYPELDATIREYLSGNDFGE